MLSFVRMMTAAAGLSFAAWAQVPQQEAWRAELKDVRARLVGVDAKERARAVEELGRFRDAPGEVLPDLTIALEDPATAEAAIRALGTLGWNAVGALPRLEAAYEQPALRRTILKEIRAIAKDIEGTPIATLARGLPGESRFDPAGLARWTLRKRAGAASARVVARGVLDDDPRIRTSAREALACIDDDGSLYEELAAAWPLARTPEARLELAKSVAGFYSKDAALLPLLVAMLDDEQVEVRHNSLESLGRLDAAAAPASIRLARMMFEDPDSICRVRAEGLLRELGPAAIAILPRLLEVLRGGVSLQDTHTALVALESLGPAAREAMPLIESLGRKLPDLVLDALVAIDRESLALQRHLAWLVREDVSPWSKRRFQTIKCLGNRGAGAMPMAKRALANLDPSDPDVDEGEICAFTDAAIAFGADAAELVRILAPIALLSPNEYARRSAVQHILRADPTLIVSQATIEQVLLTRPDDLTWYAGIIDERAGALLVPALRKALAVAVAAMETDYRQREVVRHLIEMIGGFGPAASPLLPDVLTVPIEGVEWKPEIMFALARIEPDGRSTLPYLVERLRKLNGIGMRNPCPDSVATLRAPPEAIVDALLQVPPRFEFAVVDACAALGPHAAPAKDLLLRQLDRWDGLLFKIMGALDSVLVDIPEPPELLLDRIEHPAYDAETRYAIYAIARLVRDRRLPALGAIVRLLEHSDLRLRIHASVAIGMIGPEAAGAVPALGRVLMNAPILKELEDANRIDLPDGVRRPASILDIGEVAGEALARIGPAAKEATRAILIAEEVVPVQAEQVLRRIRGPVPSPPLTLVEDRSLRVHGTWCGWSNIFTRELLPICELRRISAAEWRFSVGAYEGFGGSWIEFRMEKGAEGPLVMRATAGAMSCRGEWFPPLPVEHGVVRFESGLRPDDEYLRGTFDLGDKYRGAFVVRNPFRQR